MVAVPKETKHHGNNNNKLHSNNNMVAINRYRVARNNSGINGEVITIQEVDQEVMVEPVEVTDIKKKKQNRKKKSAVRTKQSTMILLTTVNRANDIEEISF